MESLKESSISQIKPVPGLFISDRFAARSCSLLQSLNIRYILSVTDDVPKFAASNAADPATSNAEAEAEAGFDIKHIDIDDDPTEDLIIHLKDACDWIQSNLLSDEKQAGVLVHCTQGISRSGAIVVAYLMRTLSLAYLPALELARESRPLISPNSGFEYQLRVWENCGYDVLTPDGKDKPQYRRLKANRDALLKRGEEAINRARAASVAHLAASFGKKRRTGAKEDAVGDGENGDDGGSEMRGEGWDGVKKMEEEWTRRLISGEYPPWESKKKQDENEN